MPLTLPPAAKKPTTSLGDYALSLLLLAFIWSAMLHVLKAPWWDLDWLAALVILVRYGLLTLACLFARPWPMKLVLVPSVMLWGLLDLLAVVGWFNIYTVLEPAESFLHFQF